MITAEQKLFLAIEAAVLAYGCKSASNVAARRKGIIKNLKDTKGKDAIQPVPCGGEKFVDHPVVSWLLDNFGKVGMCLFSIRVNQILNFGPSLLGRFLKSVVSLLLAQDLSMAYHWLLINKVYAHIPFFDKNRKPVDPKETIRNYLSCNLPVVLTISFAEAYARMGGAKEVLQAKSKPFSPFRFLFMLGWSRVVTDLFFWIGHYIIHRREAYFIHKKHHEHNKTKLWTNYNFSIPDLIIEAYIPMGVAFFTLPLLHKRFTPSHTDLVLLSAYVGGLEVTSHAGKAIPISSIFPPFSPLLTYWDDWNVWFHETHHNRLKCNYSITPYWDHIFGTARYE
mmetsp:Transcript_8956/g.10272  ORF Transcript_8956/g.10272 Transcript_8956/m.10272 type:complete len:337 (+) Transcript_8956:404-1414(+)